MKIGLAAGVVCLFTGPVTWAGDAWTKLSTAHFEMYSNYGTKDSTAVLQVLEHAREFFEENSPTVEEPDLPVRIVALKSAKEFKHFSGNAGAAAYYQRSHVREYIVMQEIGPAFYPGAIHEYTHLFLNQMKIKLPLWLDEGLADVYSSLRPAGNQLVVGTPPRGRMETLLSGQWLDIRQLLAANKQSPYYNERGEMGPFYSESWALAHMLLLGAKYRAGFSQFLGLIADGKSAEEALKQVYGKNVDEVASDLHSYFSTGSITVTLFKTHFAANALQPEISKPAPLETELVLADLLSSHPQTAAEAHDRLTKLESELPGNPEVEASLGYLCWQQGNQAEARAHFQRAADDGSRNPVLYFQYASLLYMNGAPSEEVMKILEKAVALKPDYLEARYSLGMEAVNQGQCGVAVSNLKIITTMKPERAYPYFSAMAYCQAKLGNLSEAQRLTELAEQYARDPKERSRAGDFKEQLKKSMMAAHPLHP